MTLKHRKPILKCPTASVTDRSIVPVLAVLVLSSTTVFAQAQDEGGSDINAAIAQDAIMQMLPDIPSDLDLAPEDYISGNDHTASARRVTVQIGPDGHMIPSADWQKHHPAQCRKQARETNVAAQTLEFKMQRISESQDGLTRHQYFTAVRLIDAESNIVKNKADGQSTVGRATAVRGGLMENPDAEGIRESLSEAMRKLGVKIGAPSDGCGEIRLVHQFGSEVDDQFGFVAGYQNESGPNVKYEWDFGDGSAPGPGDQLGRHVYTSHGTYTVTVNVSGERVREGSASIGVTVKEQEEETPIQPRDGTWTITLINSKMQNCPSMIAGAVDSAMANMMGKENRQALSFRTPFHPEPLMKYAKKLAWKQTGKNTWTTVLADKGNESINMKVVLKVEVVSPTLIKEVLDQHIIFQNHRCLATGDFNVTLDQ